jgi:cytochrome c-type biogenesis protein CcmH/NrfF
MTRRALTVAVLLALALAAMTAMTASAATPRTTLNDVEDEVMCVSCGVPLNIAESPQADRERALIQRLVDRGLTKDQVKGELKAQFGPRVIAEPDASGIGLAAWLVPVALVLAALAGLAVALPRWRRARTDAAAAHAPTNGAASPALSPDDAARLDADLARYDV